MHETLASERRMKNLIFITCDFLSIVTHLHSRGRQRIHASFSLSPSFERILCNSRYIQQDRPLLIKGDLELGAPSIVTSLIWFFPSNLAYTRMAFSRIFLSFLSFLSFLPFLHFCHFRTLLFVFWVLEERHKHVHFFVVALVR